MSPRDRALEASAPPVEETGRDRHVTDQQGELPAWPVSAALPMTLRDRDLMRILGVKHALFYVRKKRGDFRFLELQPQLPGSNTVYSGRLLTRWLDGDLQASRHFASARAAVRKPGRPGRPRKARAVESVTVLGHDGTVNR